ncbi:hypothetical protein Q9966_004689 [Columba livia]|nr:hypothetical protein Q9966_004689 [Columba livia]
MAAAGAGAGPGPGAGSSAGAGTSNPRKFSEKIALQKQRQAEETAAFEEVMMEICSTRLQAQKLRLAHSRGPYYSGSLPNVNQIGSGVSEFQGHPLSLAGFLDGDADSKVPGIHIFPSPDQPANVPLIPSALNTGGSLPDLTNLHFPSPLPTPLDPDETVYPSLSGGNSTGNLANTMTHLGISGGMGLGTGYDSPGEAGETPGPVLQPLRRLTSPMQSSLSNLSLQSSLSNPNLQASLRSPSLQSSLSNPSLQSSQSSSSIPSSLSNQSLPSSLSSSLSNPSLPTSPRSQSIQSSPSNPSLPSGLSGSSYSPMVQASITTSPRRRVPLSPLTLPMGGDSRRQHPKQFSPTMSPTLSSITQATYDPPVPNRPNLSNCSRHGPIPNIVLTGDSPPGISKEIATALAGVPGFEVEALEDELRIEPLSLDGLTMLSDPYALLTDPAVEDSFRTDRLQ